MPWPTAAQHRLRQTRRRDVLVRSCHLGGPRDIAFATFDDFPWANFLHPRFSAVSQRVDDLGARAVELLFALLRDPEVPQRHL